MAPVLYISVTAEVRVVGRKRYLYIDARDWPTGASVADYPEAMFRVVAELMKQDADVVVVTDVYDHVYDEGATDVLREIAQAAKMLRSEGFWSFSVVEKIGKGCDRVLRNENVWVVRTSHDLWMSDPMKAYIEVLKKIREVREKKKAVPERLKECFERYEKVLLKMKTIMDATKVIAKTREYMLQMKELPTGRGIYRTLLPVQIKPAFLGSGIITGLAEELELVDSYTLEGGVEVLIYQDPSSVEMLYYLQAPEFTLPPDHYFVLEKAKELVAKYTPASSLLTSRSFARKQFEEMYRSTVVDVARRFKVSLSGEEVELISSILARYTVGYGILELFFLDRKITDIYLDAPLGTKPIYIVHSQYGQCRTNIVYSEEEARNFISKLRSMSGRPFDEAHPVLDYDLPDLHVRVAVIGPPLSPDGIAFAFRLHKPTPWTLPQFISVRMLNPLAAGFLSFLVDSQATMLISGSRGAGKTSLMTSLILEIPQNQRILVQEDTLEIPVEEMRKVGFHIQRLKTRSPIGGDSAGELPPEDALRTALRLGDSAIVIGEVRSREALVLYEAMRVGAAGNVVMGTIHGDSAYSVWDRVVNDLGVPTTSFKATDIVVVNAPIRFAGSLKRHRRTVSITEVLKHWKSDPYEEGGFLDLMLYSADADELQLMEDNVRNSELLAKISRLRGIGYEEIWKEIRARADEKEMVVRLADEFNVPELMEARYYVPVHNRFLLLKERYLEEFGEVDYGKLLKELEDWTKETIVRGILAGKGKE